MGEITGNIIWVDGAYGSDTLGKVYRADAPFATLTAAKTVAQSGDTIHVRPAVYNETNLLANGVNWHFETGAFVTYTGSGVNSSIFSDSATGANAAVSCNITGNGTFQHNGTAVTGGNRAIFEITNSSSVVYAEVLHTSGTANSYVESILTGGKFTYDRSVDRNVRIFHRTVTLTSAAAATPVVVLNPVEVPAARAVYISGFTFNVNGATAWTDSTATDVRLEDSAGSPVTAATIAKAALTGNATLWPTTANVTVGTSISQGVGLTAGKGLSLVGTNAGTAATFAAGSTLVATVWGYIK